MEMLQEKVFIEFLIDGVIKVDYSEKEAVIKELKKLLNSALKSRDLMKIDTNITVLSEGDIMFAIGANSLMGEN
tara:strand:- start:373 stop:594 length:222 start_codon:yes stop_codon:yes gene_type:complete